MNNFLVVENTETSLCESCERKVDPLPCVRLDSGEFIVVECSDYAKMKSNMKRNINKN